MSHVLSPRPEKAILIISQPTQHVLTGSQDSRISGTPCMAGHGDREQASAEISAPPLVLGYSHDFLRPHESSAPQTRLPRASHRMALHLWSLLDPLARAERLVATVTPRQAP